VSGDQGATRAIVLIDGAGGSGKSTFARRLVDAINGDEREDGNIGDGVTGGRGDGDGGSTSGSRVAHACLVAVDDVSWWLHPFNWADAMLDGVVRPWLAGGDVDYRPPGWIDKGRAGSVTAVASAEAAVNILVIEGMGAARHDLADLASCIIWVNTDPHTARERLIARDLALGVNGSNRQEVEAFTDEFDALLAPFYAAEKPWQRANLVIDGDTHRPDGRIDVVLGDR
jgi:hypothetical protein